MFGGITCRKRDIIKIKVGFVRNIFDRESWKTKVPNYDVGTIVMTLTAQS